MSSSKLFKNRFVNKLFAKKSLHSTIRSRKNNNNSNVCIQKRHIYNLVSYIYIYHHHHIVLAARISLTLSRHSSQSFIALGRSSGQQPVSSHSC